jgi:hypothetical protein
VLFAPLFYVLIEKTFGKKKTAGNDHESTQTRSSIEGSTI